MSLINEALKKAQRQRSDQLPGAGPDSPGGPVEKRGKPMRAQSLLMLGAAATVLIVLSVVVTVYLVNRQPPHLSSTAPVAAKQVIKVEDDSPSPVIVAPAIQLPPAVLQTAPEKTAAVPPAPAASATRIAEEKRSVQTTAAESAPVAVAVAAKSTAKGRVAPPAPTAEPSAPPVARASAPAAAPVSNATFDARVLTFVDAIRVTGIRSSGNESKVLMNDRVYRVNDIVDRALALKLVKVEPDTLTFTDANGVVYTKNF